MCVMVLTASGSKLIDIQGTDTYDVDDGEVHIYKDQRLVASAAKAFWAAVVSYTPSTPSV